MMKDCLIIEAPSGGESFEEALTLTMIIRTFEKV